MSWGREKRWQEMVEEILGEKGEGKGWMIKLEEMRRRKEEEELRESVNEEGMEQEENTTETEVQKNENECENECERGSFCLSLSRASERANKKLRRLYRLICTG